MRSEQFADEGVVGPIPFLSASQCRLVVRHLNSSPPPPKPPEWHKARAVTDRLIYDIATQPLALEIVRAALGPDTILWGVAIVVQAAGETHAWHTDIETSRPGCRSASIWIGLHDTHSESTIELVTRSHKLGKPVQQVAVEKGRLRAEVSSEDALAWATESESNAMLVRPAIQNGQAVVFDGGIWHTSLNRDAAATRTAIVLQYAQADERMRIPDFSRLEWPFRFKSGATLPVISISGAANRHANRVVLPPRAEKKHSAAVLGRHLQAVDVPLALGPTEHWKPYPIVRGRTRSVSMMSAHASVLAPGHSPHPPHEHADEEILIILEGGAELVVLGEDNRDKEPTIVPVQTGTFVYYPAYCMHTIRNTSDRPVTYLMFRWSAPSFPGADTLTWQVHQFGELMSRESERSFATTTIIEGPTNYLSTLHAHVSIVQPGGGYDVHVDPHDVALVLHQGKVETLGQVIDGPGVVYYSAGEPHGLRNIGDTPARYLVFEFHSPNLAAIDAPIPVGPPPDFQERLQARIITARRSLRRVFNLGKRVLGRKAGVASYLIAAQRKLTGGRN